MANDIDIIIPWVDGSDEQWLKEKNNVLSDGRGDGRVNRYRDWDNLQYWFRGVEKCLPWVRKIHFVTWGHLPEWLDTDNPKLNIVKHSDYIPEEYLPTFSSHPIEMNFHRIPELSEKFIYSNDDMFFLKPLKEDFFFKDGLPVDAPIQNILQFARADGISHIVANDLNCINMSFNKKTVIKNNRGKWFNPCYGKKNLMNLYLLPVGNFTGFEDPHIPYSYLKSSFSRAWESYGSILDKTSRNKVRSNDDVNQWLIRYLQLVSGQFTPGKPFRGSLFSIGKDNGLIEKAIIGKTMPMICLSDDDTEMDFEKEKQFIKACFEKAFPEKSSFEK